MEQSVFKRPLSGDETNVYTATFKHAYAKNEPVMDMAGALATAGSAIGKGVESFLRATGLTDKGTARATGNSINELLLVGGAGGLVKNLAKGAAKAGGKSSGVTFVDGVKVEAVLKGGQPATKAPAELPSNVHNRATLGDLPTNAHNLEKFNVQLTAEQIVKGHAFNKHILSQGEFGGLGIRTHAQLQSHVEMVMSSSETQTTIMKGGKIAYVHKPTNTVVVHNMTDAHRGTVFQPENMDQYLKKEGWKLR